MPVGAGDSATAAVRYDGAGLPCDLTTRRIAWAIGTVSAAVGAAVLAAWWLRLDAITRIGAEFTPMKPNAALCVVVAGLTVANLSRAPRPAWALPAAQLAGAFLVAVGTLTLLQLVAMVDPRLDRLLLPPGADTESAHPGRMAQMSAGAFVATGAGFIALDRAKWAWTHLLAGVSASVGYVALLGYLYGVSSLYQVSAYAGMAVHMAAAACLLGLGLELCVPEHGLGALLRDSGGAGRITRTLIPTVAVVVPLIGWFTLRGEQRGWYRSSFTAAVIVASVAILGCGLTLRAASAARHSDQRRDSALQSLEALTATLEQRVAERTAAASRVASDLTAVFNAAPVGMIRLSADGGCFGVNAFWQQLSGLSLAQSLGDGWLHAVHPDDRADVRDATTMLQESGPATCRILTPQGVRTTVYAIRAGVAPDNGPVSYLATFADVEAETEAMRALDAAQARMTAAFQASSMGTALVALDGTVLEANERLAELTRQPIDALVGRRFGDLLAPEWAAAEKELRSRLLEAERPYGQLECELAGEPGERTWVVANIAVVWTGPAGPRYFVTELEDVTARRLAEGRLAHAALHDPLTGLPNRTLVQDRLEHALRRADRTGSGVALLFLDLDHFKVVNDRLGHHAGDEILVIVADRIARAARPTDTVSRFGGDEFIIVCEDLTSTSDTLRIAERFRRAISAPIVRGGADVTVDASVGIAAVVGAYTDPDLMLRDADAAMYEAKARGRGRCVVFEERMRTRLSKWVDAESGLVGAVRRGEVLAVYQPIVDLNTGTIIAVEALARWQRAGRQLVEPIDFIAVAEETGLIVELGDHILRSALVAAADARCSERGIRMSVNVSARQLLSSSYAAHVLAALSEAGVDPSVLCLELTESVLFEVADAANSLQDLRHEGVHLAIDDFRVGFSSLSYLRTFPVDILKIDKVFVDGVADNSTDAAIVAGIIELGRSLGIEVIVEGVERRSQLDALVALGCTLGQGFLFSHAAPAAEALDLRRTRIDLTSDVHSETEGG